MGLVKKPVVVDTEVPRAPTPTCQDLWGELEGPDPARRREAARELASCEGSSDLLVRRLGLELDPSVREALTTSLVLRADEAAVAGLASYLRSEDAAVRNEAVEALKQIPDEVAPFLAELLEDQEPDVRILAVSVLEALRHPLIEEWLIQIIDADPHVNVCGSAVDLLAEVGTGRCLPSLRNLLKRLGHEPYIAFAGGVALRRIEGGEA